MRTRMCLMTVVALLLFVAVAGGAYADGITPGISVDWSGHRGAEGEGIGFTGRGLFSLCCGALMVDGAWARGHSQDVISYPYPDAAPRNGLLESVSTDIWSASANFIRTEEREGAWDIYYGGGVGWHKVDGGSFEEDSFGGQAILGATCDSNWFFEARWVFDTDFDWGDGETSNVDGIRFSFGRWFR